MAGLQELCGEIRARCIGCGKVLDVDEIAEEVFRRILEALARGERVQINKFGSFYTTELAERTIVSNFDGAKHKMEARKVIRFHAIPDAKNLVNGKPPNPPKKKRAEKKGNKR